MAFIEAGPKSYPLYLVTFSVFSSEGKRSYMRSPSIAPRARPRISLILVSSVDERLVALRPNQTVERMAAGLVFHALSS